MNPDATLGPWVRRFLLEHLVHERNLSRHTQHSYRDALALLIPFVAKQAHVVVDRLTVVDVTPDRVRSFLQDLEASRGCAITTRNQRLGALHAFARFVGEYSPEHLDWAGHIRNIPFKRGSTTPVTYLEKPEIDALLASPDPRTAQGQRDHALLLFLYNTGARADEAAHVTIADLTLAQVSDSGYSSTRIHGKGNKTRQCPLWSQTVAELRRLIGERRPTDRVFLILDTFKSEVLSLQTLAAFEKV